jgi:Concanavalin A-like lectin/glucanases superfamily/Secretion system C-terminal sorting domain
MLYPPSEMNRALMQFQLSFNKMKKLTHHFNSAKHESCSRKNKKNEMKLLLLACFFLWSNAYSFAQSATALNFGGSDDYVDCGMNYMSFTGDLSIEFWVYVYSPDYCVISKGLSGDFEIALQPNQVKFYQGSASTGTYWAMDFNFPSIAYNQWSHIAIVRDNTAKTVKAYLNDVQSAYVQTYAGNILASNNPVLIGKGSNVYNPNLPFNNAIDELRIWNRVLSQCEIQANKNSELPAGQTGLVAYYKFNQGTANGTNTGITTLSDASGNSRDGTLVNFALTGTSSNWTGGSPIVTGSLPTATWTGATSTNWSVATNWSPNCIVPSGQHIVVPTTTNMPTLTANQTVADLSLTGTNKISLGNYDLTANSVTGGSSSTYVVTNGTGALTIKALSTGSATNFPIGASTTSYDPVTIKPTNSVDFAAKVKATASATDFSGTILNYTKVAPRQWDITPSETAGVTLMTLRNGGTAYTPPTPALGHYKSTNVWESLSATYNSNVWTATTHSFSPFGVGAVGGFTAVLPVELLSFEGKSTLSTNVLTWTTTFETNNKGFDIQRLNPHTHQWETLGFVKAASQAPKDAFQDYAFTDNTPLSNLSYYRLKQIDFDGTETLSKMLSIVIKKINKLGIYPNPVSTTLNIQTENNSDFLILNLLGQEVLRGQTAQAVDVSVLPQGSYILKLGTEQRQFVKQ